MRITVRLDDRLVTEVKKHAAETGRTLTALLNEALREVLARRSVCIKREPVRLKTVKGNGIRSGVNLDNSAALLDMMEAEAGGVDA